MERRSLFSSAGARSAFPNGFTIFSPGRILLEPTIWATGIMAQIWAVGIPILSISFVSVAPQRVLVPQVDVKITPETPAALRSLAIFSPSFLITSTMQATPVVL